MLQLRRPFDGLYTVTQEFANLNDMEPNGYLYADGSIGYVWRDGARLGHYHNGVDYALPCGTPLMAQADGVVVFAGWDTTGFGNCVIVNHSSLALGAGLETLLAHMTSIAVKPGQRLRAGQRVGLSGTSGNSTGCHLHNSLRKDGVYRFIGPYLAAPVAPVVKPAPLPVPVKVSTPKQKGIALGRVLSDDGNAVLLSAADIALLVTAGVKVARVELRLGSAHTTWESALLANYRTVILMLQEAGISVVGLLDAALVAGAKQEAWNQNNAETTPGASATNPFVDSFVQAVAQIVLALGDVVSRFEIWNEPNSYSTRSGTVYNGGSYIYPSVYATLLTRAYEVIAGLQPAAGVLTGGLFAHNIGGTLSRASAGESYLGALCSVLAARGCGTSRPWPFTAVGYHLYLDQGGALGAGHVTTYVGWIAETLLAWKIPAAQSGLLVTETGWTTHAVSPAVQAANLAALYAECATLGAVSGVLWFLLSDVPAANLSYGLCTAVTDTPPEAPKAAYGAYCAIT